MCLKTPDTPDLAFYISYKLIKYQHFIFLWCPKPVRTKWMCIYKTLQYMYMYYFGANHIKKIIDHLLIQTNKCTVLKI